MLLDIRIASSQFTWFEMSTTFCTSSPRPSAPGVLTSVTVCCTPGRCICTWENNGPSTTRTGEKSHGMISASLSGRNKYAPLRSRPGRAWYLTKSKCRGTVRPLSFSVTAFKSPCSLNAADKWSLWIENSFTSSTTSKYSMPSTFGA